MNFTNHYCEGTEKFVDEVWKSDITNTWHLLIRYESTTIKYCPFCGVELN